MKTVKQIRNKVRSLKKKLEKKQIKENFGDKEQRELDDYIGNIYQYDYNKKRIIIPLQKEFFQWCINFDIPFQRSILDKKK